MSRRSVITAILAALAILAIAAWVVSRQPTPPSYDAQTGREVLADGKNSRISQPQIMEDRLKSRRVEPVIRSQNQASNDEAAVDESQFRTPDPETDLPDLGHTWEDPVNEEVLGEKRWMARPSPEEVARIERILNEPRDDPQARYDRNLDRRSAIETVRTAVDRCVAEVRETSPEAIGRVSIIFDFDTTSGQGVISDGRIGKIWKLDEYPEFQPCVERGLANLRFQASTDDNIMEVEYPFFYENAP